MTDQRKKGATIKGVTYKKRKKESRARNVTLELPEQLFKAVLNAPADDPAAIQATLYKNIYMGGIGELEAERFIFKPDLESLTALPPGILDLKEVLPPPDLIPALDRPLDTFLRSLILKADIHGSLTHFTDGWPAPLVKFPLRSSRCAAWYNHRLALLQKQRVDARLYRTLVSGRFAPVIRLLRRLTRSQSTKAEAAQLRRSLSNQALIWCCHDVQMVIARLAVSDAAFGPMIASTQVKLAPERVRRLLAERRGLIEALLDVLYGRREWRERELPLPDLFKHSHDSLVRGPLMRALQQRIEARWTDGEMFRADISQHVAERIGAIAAHLREGGPDMAATMPISEEEKTLRSLSAVWFGGSKVAMAAVAVLRLIQAEHQIGLLIDELVLTPGDLVAPREGVALPPFDPGALPGWRTRAVTLLDFYRSTLLRDSDYTPDTISREAIDTARDFLIARGQRRREDHHGGRDDPRRAFYLLDVVPEHRFAVG